MNEWIHIIGWQGLQGFLKLPFSLYSNNFQEKQIFTKNTFHAFNQDTTACFFSILGFLFRQSFPNLE